jgi:putative transposase
MRKSRFTEAQIVDIVREYDAGVAPKELARRHGIHVNTIRLWKSKYAGMDVSDVVRLKQLEAENTQMHRIIAKLTLKVDAMDELIRKNGWGLRSDKKRSRPLQRSGLSQRAACAINVARTGGVGRALCGLINVDFGDGYDPILSEVMSYPGGIRSGC